MLYADISQQFENMAKLDSQLIESLLTIDQLASFDSINFTTKAELLRYSRLLLVSLTWPGPQ